MLFRSKALAENVDQLIVGGGIANTFMLAAGLNIGKSLAERDLLKDRKSVVYKNVAKRRQFARQSFVVLLFANVQAAVL